MLTVKLYLTIYIILLPEKVLTVNLQSSDSVYVAYDGKLIDGSSFDNRKFPVWIDLANTLQGFREGVSELRTGKFSENSNGIIDYSSFGVGLFFIPSGIGYFR